MFLPESTSSSSHNQEPQQSSFMDQHPNMQKKQVLGQQSGILDIAQYQQHQRMIALQQNMHSTAQQPLSHMDMSDHQLNSLFQQLQIHNYYCDSSSQTGNVASADWQEETYQRIKSMNDTFFPELNEMYKRIASKLQQYDGLPQQPANEQFEKLKFFKVMLERLIMFLQTNKSEILPYHKDKISGVQKQIVSILSSSRPREHVAAMQQGQMSQPNMHRGNAAGADWQEEIYQKIKSMNDTYFPELNEMYQKMAAKLQQYDGLPQQPENGQFEKLKFFKVMLERIIMFLQTNKSEVQPYHKDKIPGVQKQIVSILTSKGPRKHVAAMQQGHMSA